jgi:hypothetical protein
MRRSTSIAFAVVPGAWCSEEEGRSQKSPMYSMTQAALVENLNSIDYVQERAMKFTVPVRVYRTRTRYVPGNVLLHGKNKILHVYRTYNSITGILYTVFCILRVIFYLLIL